MRSDSSPSRAASLFIVGRDLHEAERVRRLMPLQVSVAQSPAEALPRLVRGQVVLLEDRAWGSGEADALDALREQSAARTLALILSRRRGERGEKDGIPIVERPYKMEEIVQAMRLSLLRRRT